MIKNYFLIGLRNLQKHPGFSTINIAGLGLGIATCMLLVTWVLYELSFDRFHQHEDRLYRSSMEYSFGGQVARTSVSPTALLPTLLSLPEVQSGTRFYNQSRWNPVIIQLDDKMFSENRFCFADSTFFNVFSFKLISGNPAKALNQPNQVLLSESTAQKYFGDTNPVGKQLRINNQTDYVITGIIQDSPHNSFVQYDFIASFSSLRAAREEPAWWGANYQTFVVLHEGSEVKAVEEKTSDIALKAVSKDIQGKGDYIRYNMMLLKDLHLHSDFANELEIVSNILYVYVFSGIALLILIIACINYINLTTARATERAREVGIRKVAGALRNQVFYQFMAESACITFAAFLVAFTMAVLVLPFFNELTGTEFTSEVFFNTSFLFWSFVGFCLISFVAGAYPAIAMSNYKPVSILKGNFRNSSRGIRLRQSLVVVQFAVSVILIVGTLVIMNQLQYLQDKKLGYDKENVIIVPLDGPTQEKYTTLKTELLKSGSVKNVSLGSSAPALVQAGYSISLAENTEHGIALTGLIIDEDYIPAMGMEILYGENFTEEDIQRINEKVEDGFILNEAAVADLGLDPSEAVGRKVNFNGRMGEIKAVIKDFHFSSLHHAIKPLVMFVEPENLNKMLVRLSPGNVTERLEAIQRITTSLLPHRPFEYSFLDQEYEAMYSAEQRMGTIFIVFAVLAIVIACLGLLGLVSYSALQKTKEIGIRKVLGASTTAVVVLITKDFFKLVIAGIVIGLPLSAYLMSIWLENFAYRIDVGVIPMVVAAAVCVIISFGTAAYHAFKAARINPSETLRSE